VRINLTGLVTTGDRWRSADGLRGAVWFGDVDLVSAISEAGFSKPVTVAIMDERYTGDLSVDVGWGYSEYTPMDPDVLKVGDHDLIEIIGRFEGQQVRVIIADEPVDTSEEVADADPST
jgi:hypothetical protein